MGKSIDAVVQKSTTVNAIAEDYLSGERSLAGDIKDVLQRPAVGAGDIKDLSVAALIFKLAGDATGDEKSKLMSLVDAAKKLGLK